jgi:hypothetical protein
MPATQEVFVPFKRSICIVALVPALAVAACGGGGDGDDDFLAQVDAICTESAKQSNAAFGEGSPTSAEEAVALDETILDVRQQEMDEFRAVEPPEDVKAGYEEFVAKRGEILSAEEARLEADQQADQQASQKAGEAVNQAFEAADQPAEDIGLEACAGILPPEEEDEVRAVTEQFFTANTREEFEVACESATANYIEQLGGLEQCHEPGEPRTIEISEVSGVSEVSAEVGFVPTGGPADGQNLRATFVYQDGQWKVDALGPAPPPAEAKAPGGDAAVTQAYNQASEEVNDAIDTFKARVQDDLDAGNLEAVKVDASTLRDAVFDFDATLREIPFPDSLVEDVNALLDANGTVIEDLDGIGEATSLTDAADRVDLFVQDFNSLLEPASAALSEGL